MERIAIAVATTEEDEQIVRRTVEAFNEPRYEIFDEGFAEDVIDHGPAGETRGREGPMKGRNRLITAFPDLVIPVDDLIAEGDTVALRTTHRGTHDGEFMGIEPTDKQIEVGSKIVVRFEDGEVVERWLQYDTFGLMQQLGAIEPPGAYDDSLLRSYVTSKQGIHGEPAGWRDALRFANHNDRIRTTSVPGDYFIPLS